MHIGRSYNDSGAMPVDAPDPLGAFTSALPAARFPDL